MVHSPVRRQSGTAVTPQEAAQNDLAYQRTLAQRSQQADARKNFVDKLALERERAILPKAQGGLGMLEGSLPRIDDQTRDADIVAAAKQYAALHGNNSAFSPDGGLRPPPQAAGSAIASAAQPTGAPAPSAQYAGFNVTPAERAADLALGRKYGGPPVRPPDIHTDLRDSPEHGSINPIPGQPLRPMPMSGTTAWNYPAQAAPAVADAVRPPDEPLPTEGLNARAKAAPGVAQSVAVPQYGGFASVRMPTWQENLVKQYPEIGKAGTAANDAFVKAFKAGGADPTKAAGIAANIYSAKAQDPTAPGGAAYQSPIVAADGTAKLSIGASTAPGSAGAAPGQAVAPVNFAGFDVGATDIKPPENAPLAYAKEAGQNARSRWEEQMQDPLSPRSLANAADRGLTNVFSGAVDAVGGFFNPNWKSVRPPDKPVLQSNPELVTNPETPGRTPAATGVDTTTPIALAPYNWSTPSGGASKSLSLGPGIEPGPQNMINAGSSNFALGDKKKKSVLGMPDLAGF